jgi:hypothetical protein
VNILLHTKLPSNPFSIHWWLLSELFIMTAEKWQFSVTPPTFMSWHFNKRKISFSFSRLFIWCKYGLFLLIQWLALLILMLRLSSSVLLGLFLVLVLFFHCEGFYCYI